MTAPTTDQLRSPITEMDSMAHSMDREKLREKNCDYRGNVAYSGKATELVAAGLVRPEQLPGAEGMPKSGATFYDGQLMTRWQRAKHDEKYLNIARYGSRFRVYVGVSEEVRAERKKLEELEEHKALEEKRAQEVRKDPGTNEEAKLVTECSAVFAVGDQVFANGVVAEITGEYRLRSVSVEDGEYLSSNGKKMSYQPGYVCRDTTGDEFFFCAHQLQNRYDKNRVSYLRLVRSQSAS